MNTSKIKTVFNSPEKVWIHDDHDFGSRIKLKCHQSIQRKEKTIEGESCTNWELIDRLGIPLPKGSKRNDDLLWHHLDDPNYPFYENLKGCPGNVFSSTRCVFKYTIIKYTTVPYHHGKRGFILKNGTFERFEPIGITWNDSYCRRISNAGPSGCFVKRDLSKILNFDYEGNNCNGPGLTNSPGRVEIMNP